MQEIRNQELQHEAGAHNSSFGPVDPMPQEANGHAIQNAELGPIGRNKRDEYLLCHYFDYIGGTSTGGLVAICPCQLRMDALLELTKELRPRLSAIMLGRLRMSVTDCLALYEDMAERVFGRAARRTSLWGLWRSKWKASNLEKAINDIVYRFVPQPDGDLDNIDDHIRNLDRQYPRLRGMHAPDDICKT